MVPRPFRILHRAMATIAKQTGQPISYTPEGAVLISYKDLTSSPLSLSSSIGEKYIFTDSLAMSLFVFLNLRIQ